MDITLVVEQEIASLPWPTVVKLAENELRRQRRAAMGNRGLKRSETARQNIADGQRRRWAARKAEQKQEVAA